MGRYFAHLFSRMVEQYTILMNMNEFLYRIMFALGVIVLIAAILCVNRFVKNRILRVAGYIVIALVYFCVVYGCSMVL